MFDPSQIKKDLDKASGRGGGGGTPLYKLYRYLLPHQVQFLHRLGVKFFRELQECMNVFIVAIPNE